jgi:hypothetical protein
VVGRVYLKKNGKLQPFSDPSVTVLTVNTLTRWLYMLFLGIDANFHLKRKNVSNDAANPDLNQGCAYIVEEKEYKKYLSEYKAESKPVCLFLMLEFA